MGFIDRMRALFKQARQQSPTRLLLADISMQLQQLADSLRHQVEAAASGRNGSVDTRIEYIINDRSGGELQTEWQDNDYVTSTDILDTNGYKALVQSARENGINIKLTEEQVEEVDDEDRVRFCVILSGWAD